MNLLAIVFLSATYFSCAICNANDVVNNLNSTNLTNPDKDMYVIHATVYQIGILTNKTDNMTDNYYNSTGNQESVTLYHSNGTNVDLSKIPEPFLTNITAQTLVGVAPVLQNNGSGTNVWNALDQMRHPGLSTQDQLSPGEQIAKRSLDYDNDFFLPLFKRDTTPVKVMNGSAVIPSEAGIQSIGLPPLLSFNNNLTEIPVPIPNMSVVHYAKVNTLVQKP